MMATVIQRQSQNASHICLIPKETIPKLSILLLLLVGWLVSLCCVVCVGFLFGGIFFFLALLSFNIIFFLHKPTSSRDFHKNLKGKKNSLWTFTLSASRLYLPNKT